MKHPVTGETIGPAMGRVLQVIQGGGPNGVSLHHLSLSTKRSERLIGQIIARLKRVHNLTIEEHTDIYGEPWFKFIPPTTQEN